MIGRHGRVDLSKNPPGPCTEAPRMRGSLFSGCSRQAHRHCIGRRRNGRLFLDQPTGLFAKPVCIMFNYS